MNCACRRAGDDLRPDKTQQPSLPYDASSAEDHFHIISSEDSSQWDFLWSAHVDEQRERGLHRGAIAIRVASYENSPTPESDEILRAAAALKVLFSPSVDLRPTY